MSKAKPTSEREGFDREIIRELAELLNEGLSEIEHGLRVRVARPIQVVQAGAGMPAIPVGVSEAPSTQPAPRPAEIHPGTVRSPMVGTAYRAPAPGPRPLSRSARR